MGRWSRPACCRRQPSRMTTRERLFLTPVEKFMKYGIVPWKLILNVLLLILVTAQVRVRVGLAAQHSKAFVVSHRWPTWPQPLTSRAATRLTSPAGCADEHPGQQLRPSGCAQLVLLLLSGRLRLQRVSGVSEPCCISTIESGGRACCSVPARFLDHLYLSLVAASRGTRSR